MAPLSGNRRRGADRSKRRALVRRAKRSTSTCRAWRRRRQIQQARQSRRGGVWKKAKTTTWGGPRTAEAPNSHCILGREKYRKAGGLRGPKPTTAFSAGG